MNLQAAAIWESASVRRWHTNLRLARIHDPLGSHQWRVTMLMLAVDPDLPRDAMIGALTHDVGEWATGDVPPVAKTEETRRIEARARAKMMGHNGGPELDPVDGSPLLKWADKLDALAVAVLHGGAVGPEWRQARREVYRMSADLGPEAERVRAEVMAVVEESA